MIACLALAGCGVTSDDTTTPEGPAGPLSGIAPTFTARERLFPVTFSLDGRARALTSIRRESGDGDTTRIVVEGFVTHSEPFTGTYLLQFEDETGRLHDADQYLVVDVGPGREMPFEVPIEVPSDKMLTHLVYSATGDGRNTHSYTMDLMPEEIPTESSLSIQRRREAQPSD
jgi:hypothetical protein